jgi:hypothetical protein
MGSDAEARELFSEERSAEVVAASFAGTPDPRPRQVITSLVQHLHAFVKDVELTEDEWGVAIDFLTRTGQMCSDTRQEFILLSDVLGVSMLVETINHRTGGSSTESTVLGPFHMVESPPRELGDDVDLDGEGTPCLVSGRVTGPDGEPLAGASVDVWQTNEHMGPRSSGAELDAGRAPVGHVVMRPGGLAIRQLRQGAPAECDEPRVRVDRVSGDPWPRRRSGQVRVVREGHGHAGQQLAVPGVVHGDLRSRGWNEGTVGSSQL